MIRGEGTEIIAGVTPQEVFEFVMDPSQYSKADTKIIDVRKIADTTDGGMVAIEEGKFLGLGFLRGSVVTRYSWKPDYSEIRVRLVHGLLKHLNAYFEIEPVDGGTRVHHVEEMAMAGGAFGRMLEVTIGQSWIERSVPQEVREIKRLMEAGERGKWPQ